MPLLDRLALTAKLLPGLPKLTAHKPNGTATVGDLIEAQAKRRPVHPFLRYGDREQSYGELNADANRIAHWARAQGVARGDVVALCMENRAEYVAIWAGIAKLGATTALINTNLTGQPLAHAIATSRARHLVLGEECLERFASASHAMPSPLALWIARDAEQPRADWPAGAQDLAEALREQPD